MARITFVDKEDKIIGYGTKEEAIAKGIIHRISRIFVFNPKGEVLIQKRSDKVASPGKWDQSAAGHVDEGEDYAEAAAREAREEIGLSNASLKEVGKFYSEETDDGQMKKRFNVLFAATFDGALKADEDEVSEIKWIKPHELEIWMKEHPDDFTQGFLQTYQYYLKHS